MWRGAPDGSYAFSGMAADQEVLFVPDPDLTPLRAALSAEFRGSTVTSDDVLQFTNLFTPFRTSHVKKATLAPMEAAGEIQVIASAKRRRNS